MNAGEDFLLPLIIDDLFLPIFASAVTGSNIMQVASDLFPNTPDQQID
jgi:hypothetical protein